jgi:methyl-accepting chemotaxis protein
MHDVPCAGTIELGTWWIRARESGISLLRWRRQCHSGPPVARNGLHDTESTPVSPRYYSPGLPGKALEEIVQSIKKVSEVVAEIAAASREQATGIEQMNKAMIQMDDVTQQNAAMVEEMAAASDAMSEQARELQQLMAFFTVDAPAKKAPQVSVQAGKPRPGNRRQTATAMDTAKRATPAVQPKEPGSVRLATAADGLRLAGVARSSAEDGVWQEF